MLPEAVTDLTRRTRGAGRAAARRSPAFRGRAGGRPEGTAGAWAVLRLGRRPLNPLAPWNSPFGALFSVHGCALVAVGVHIELF